ncbi:MAG: DNA polymerase III subunit delta' [Acidimicrobiales bacterium]
MTDADHGGVEDRGVRRAGRVFDGLVGQPRAVAALRAAARAPVHAYLFVGPPGSGTEAAAGAFAAALLCPDGGCGECDVCLRVAAGVHPDLVVVEREGASITVAQARAIQRLAMRTPNERPRKVLVLVDFHLVREAAGTLLKVVEEPPASTVFVILAEQVPPELGTIASRCVRVDFTALGVDDLVVALTAGGVDPAMAAEAAAAAGGRLDRARLLAGDPGFAARRAAWQSVPARLDGTGAAVAVVAAELVDLLSAAAVAPLEARQAAERAALEERVERTGERGSGRRELADRHKREGRRLRTDELRFGLAVLSMAYRDALVAGTADPRACAAAVDELRAAAENLARNPSEALFLQALLLRLPALVAGIRA